MEILVVIIVIAVLTAIAVPLFVKSAVRSKEDSLRKNLKVYRNAVQRYLNDTGTFPSNLSDLAATSAPASGLNGTGGSKAIIAQDWDGPYIESVSADPISGAAFNYGVLSPNVGKVTSSAAGSASDGSAYSTW